MEFTTLQKQCAENARQIIPEHSSSETIFMWEWVEEGKAVFVEYFGANLGNVFVTDSVQIKQQ